MTHVTINENSVSQVYVNRLNSLVRGIWYVAPVMARARQIALDFPSSDKQKGITFPEALATAKQEVEIGEEPQCLVSDNEDGKTNVSFVGGGGVSCMYTVDAEGIALCKEYLEEHLDLSDYITLLTVAITVYCDLTGTSHDSDAVTGACVAYENEPEWEGDDVLPN